MKLTRKADSTSDHYDHVIIPVGDEFLVAAGGAETNSVSNSCELYEISTNQWKPLPQLNIARRCHTGCVVGKNTIYLFGGMKAEWAVINEIEWLDLQGDQQWKVIRPDNSFSPRHWCTVLNIGSSVMIFGG